MLARVVKPLYTASAVVMLMLGGTKYASACYTGCCYHWFWGNQSNCSINCDGTCKCNCSCSSCGCECTS